MILHYFTEYLTCMLTLGLRLYRSSNLVVDLKKWENFESNLQACIFQGIRYNIDGIRWNFKEGEREVKTEDSS